MRGLIKGKFTSRLFISMLAVLLIPCCILYIIYQRTVAKSVAAEIQTIIQDELSASMRLLDLAMRSYQNRITFFVRNEDYQTYNNLHSFTTDSEGRISSLLIGSDINYIYSLDSSIDCFFVYFNEADTIIAAGLKSSMYRPSNFFDHYYFDYDIPDMKAYLLKCDTPMLLHSKRLSLWANEGEYISLIYPIGAGRLDRAVICVSVDVFSEYFDIHAKSLGAGVMVCTSDNQYLFSNGIDQAELTILEAEDFSSINNGDSIQLGDKKYLVLQQISHQTGLRAISLLPMDNEIYSTLFDVGQFFAVFLLLTGGIGILVIFLLVRFNYIPVKLLTQKALSSVDSRENFQPSSDDLDVISHTINYLKEENIKLNTAKEATLPLICMARLQYLLNGNYTSLEEFNADCEQVGISFSHPYFCVSVFLLPENSDSLRDTIAESLSKVICKSIDSKYVATTTHCHLVFIHNVPSSEFISNFEPFYSALGLLNDKFSITSTVGVGRVYQGTSLIARSMFQAVNALDYRFIKGTGIVISYNDIDSNLNEVCPYPHQALRQFSNAVASDDILQIQSCTDNLIQYISSHNMPLFLARSVCADMIKGFLSDSKHSVANTYQYSKALLQLSESESISDLFEILHSLQSVLDGSDSETSESDSNQLIKDIVDYINQNYCRCDFSIQEIAEQFSMLPSNLSNFFKEHMQTTVMSYLIDLRMETARQLLKTTTLSLKEICERIGYYNVSSFIRRFKACEGITPNAYRFKG